MGTNKIQELEKAGAFYHSIIATETNLGKGGLFWKLSLLKKLCFFKDYTIQEKFEYLKSQTDKNNRFREFVYNHRYDNLENYYHKWLAEYVRASSKLRPQKEEIRCLFFLLDEIIRQDCYKIKSLLKDKDTVVDVGANIGIFTTAVKHYFPKNKVIAFEPASETHATLKENLNKYKNVVIHNMGLGEADETKVLRITAKNIANRIDDKADSDMKAESLKKEKIKVVKLDNYIKQKADVIKLDIEGYEEFALAGAKEFINKHTPLIICANEHSKNQKMNLASRMLEINPAYKHFELSDVALCFYLTKKHRDRVAKLKPPKPQSRPYENRRRLVVAPPLSS